MSMEQRKNFRLNYEPVELRPMLENLISQHRLKADKPTEFKLIMKEDCTEGHRRADLGGRGAGGHHQDRPHH